MCSFERNSAAALAIGMPQVHLVMPQGLGTGTPLIQHGLHGLPGHHGVALVAECGQHFKHVTAATAIDVTLRFLAHFGLVEPRAEAPALPQQRYELLKTLVVQTPGFRFVRPLVGFERFAEGELIATDGDAEIRGLCADCTVLMPARRPIVGREGVYLTRPI
jgi:hypothetical protein